MFPVLRTPRWREVADCGEFYEVTFFCISSKNLFGDSFCSLKTDFTGSVNDPVERLVWRHCAVAFNELNKTNDITEATIKK